MISECAPAAVLLCSTKNSAHQKCKNDFCISECYRKLKYPETLFILRYGIKISDTGNPVVSLGLLDYAEKVRQAIIQKAYLRVAKDNTFL